MASMQRFCPSAMGQRNVADSFEATGLGVPALGAVAELGYAEPTAVQASAIPAVLAGGDVMVAAQTGTGKTAAFLLSMLDGLGHAREDGGPMALVVTPTRELALQIADVAHVVGAHTGHRCAVVVGGIGYEVQRGALQEGCELLVATPGRLLDLMEQGACDLSSVEVLVLDEADRMLDMGFMPSVRRIVEALPRRRQTLLFSATLEANVLKDIGSFVVEPAVVEVDRKGTTAQNVEQYVLGVSAEAKKRVLVEVLRREGAERVLVFVKGKHRADHLSRILAKKGFSSASIHGDRTQSQRQRALLRFANGEVDVLVATDVLARGIDIAEVRYVVNMDVPHEPEDYVHRIGRTGRAGERGWALTLCAKNEYVDFRAIEKLTAQVVPTYKHAAGLDVGQEPAMIDPARKVCAATSKRAAKRQSGNREGSRSRARR